MSTETTRYVNENGEFMGYCNSCGEETELYGVCDNGCEDGEIVEYEDGDYSDEDED